MKVDQIDFDKGTIRLHPRSTKNKEGREVTMTERIHDIFAQLSMNQSRQDFLFTRSNGKPVQCFREIWKKACAAADVPDLLFHDLRRTAARNFRLAGAAETVIMKIGGWLTRSVFERYAIVSQTDVQDALHKLEDQRNHWVQKNAKNQEQRIS